MFFDQSPFAVRFEWGAAGIDGLGPVSDIVVIVDVLSFSTCVDIATARGASVLPFPMWDQSAADYARQKNALLAARRSVSEAGYSLSPLSLVGIPAGTRLVLPSPNGSALSLRAASYGTVVAACLRNAAAVAEFVRLRGGTVTVIACGERWSDGSLRPSWEDLIGAGAVISHLPGSRSPEAQTAAEAFQQTEATLRQRLRECSSGRELSERGFAGDVELAGEIGVSQCVPILIDGEFVAYRT
ncbi:MAG: 2-phosphosulfolactate phosphatase [Planctomycetota bacterium]